MRGAETVAPPAPALWRDHTMLLICSMPKLVPFLASPERNFEHRHRQPELVASDQQVWSPRLHASRRWSNRLRRSWDRREERAVRPRSSGDVLADPQPLLGDGGRDGNRLRARLENERPPPPPHPSYFSWYRISHRRAAPQNMAPA